MADTPRLQEPYANVTVPTADEGKNKPAKKVPAGPKTSKPARLDLIMQGLIGAR
jgi:hypothetical protein